MARPTPNNPTWAQKMVKMTDERIKKLEEVFALDGSIWEACYYADISTQTYYNWIKQHPELLDKFNRLREKPVLAARQEVVKWVRNNPEFALKYLKNKRSKEFSERQELTGKDWKDVFPTVINVIAPKDE